jgi:hypothetical protein
MALLSRVPRPLRSVLAVACLSLAITAEARGQDLGGDLEQQVKAAYLLNFTRYVDWPPGTYRRGDDPVNLCVVGPEGLADVVRRTVEGRRSRGRPVRVVVPDTPAQAGDCHLVFLAPAGGAVSPWLAAVRSSRALVVGEGPRFLERGGMVAFVIVNQTVRFEIDQAAARRAGLRISSRVLALATRVVGGEAAP